MTKEIKKDRVLIGIEKPRSVEESTNIHLIEPSIKNQAFETMMAINRKYANIYCNMMINDSDMKVYPDDVASFYGDQMYGDDLADSEYLSMYLKYMVVGKLTEYIRISVSSDDGYTRTQEFRKTLDRWIGGDFSA